jgi:lysophospholipase L1-like esterase
MTHARVLLAAGVSLALAAACHQDELFSPQVPPYAGGALFQRYVSMGNSIAMGIQSGGIDDSSQRAAYPVLVAGVMGGDPFYYPSLAEPGCPPRYTNVFTGARVGGGTSTTCAFRSAPLPPYLSNVAVTGAQVLDLLQNGPGAGAHSNGLTQLALGGRTQVQAMSATHPTFVTLWIGDNDVLGAVLTTNSGDSTLITPTATFQSQYRMVMDSIKAAGAKALLIGVEKVTTIPYLSSGQTYFAIKNTPPSPFPSNFAVGPNCAPRGLGGQGDSVLVPFPFGLALIAQAQANPTTTVTLTCTETQTVQPAEFAKLATTVAAYNAYILAQAKADSANFGFWDVNPTFDSLRVVAGQVAPFPNTSAACTGSPFGLAFSCDGVHPSTAAHRLIAKKVVQTINAWFGTAIPAITP